MMFLQNTTIGPFLSPWANRVGYWNSMHFQLFHRYSEPGLSKVRFVCRQRVYICQGNVIAALAEGQEVIRSRTERLIVRLDRKNVFYRYLKKQFKRLPLDTLEVVAKDALSELALEIQEERLVCLRRYLRGGEISRREYKQFLRFGYQIAFRKANREWQRIKRTQCLTNIDGLAFRYVNDQEEEELVLDVASALKINVLVVECLRHAHENLPKSVYAALKLRLKGNTHKEIGKRMSRNRNASAGMLGKAVECIGNLLDEKIPPSIYARFIAAELRRYRQPVYPQLKLAKSEALSNTLPFDPSVLIAKRAIDFQFKRKRAARARS